jgi:hypothetical protein
MLEALQAYVRRVRELAEHVRSNEQATKQSLVGPLFTILGYDLTDHRECIPEYRVDFGPNRSIKPIDWAFLRPGQPGPVRSGRAARRPLAAGLGRLRRSLPRSWRSAASSARAVAKEN